MMPKIPWGFVGGFALIFVGYNQLSLSVQYYYYLCSSVKAEGWKIQPRISESVGEPAGIPWLPSWKLLQQMFPILSRGRDNEARGRINAPNHDLICTVNLVMASSFAGTVAELAKKGNSRIQFSVQGAGGVCTAIGVTITAIAWELLLEYYWHRLMHLPFCYRRFHKMHHFYKAPRPFDDLYIHPIEAFGYYCILYSPAFVFPIHLAGFTTYMMLMGLCGVLDHCGVKLAVLGVYDTEDHDLHHQKFDCNYGFPFVILDILHGTYCGTFLGFRYHARAITGPRPVA